MHHELVETTTIFQSDIDVDDLLNRARHEICPGEKASAAHPRRRGIFGVAVRNTNPRRIRRYAKLVENVLPSDDFATRGMKKPLAIRPAAQAGFENGSGMKCRQPRFVQAMAGPRSRLSGKTHRNRPVHMAIRPWRRGNGSAIQTSMHGTAHRRKPEWPRPMPQESGTWYALARPEPVPCAMSAPERLPNSSPRTGCIVDNPLKRGVGGDITYRHVIGG